MTLTKHGQNMRNVRRIAVAMGLVVGVALGIVLAGLFAGTPGAFAFGLLDADYDYLLAQHIDKDRPPMLDLSPKERTRVHDLINDPRTAGDPAKREKNVRDELALFLGHQVWEKEHPGQLWNAPAR
jgi:hypothetical protein